MAVSVIRHIYMWWHTGTGTQRATCCCVNRTLGIWCNPLACAVHVQLMVDWVEFATCLKTFWYVIPKSVLPYSGKYSWQKIFADFVVCLTSAKILSAN